MPIHIDRDLCKGCALCLYYCPKGVFEMTDEVNRKGFTVAGVAHAAACTACRLCEMACPDLAIYVEVEDKVVPEAAAGGA